jgi:nucleoside-diphosphate-sugar epimerase
VTLNISKAQEELGYRPVISIEDGLAEMSSANGSPGNSKAE